jgi:hypothetical protein
MRDGPDLTPPDPDSDGCLCVVASFVSAARTIERVTAEAAKRAMMSPLLSDFIEFRFADLGPQPGQGGDRSAAIRRITDALLNPQSIAGRNYFALVVVDRSAAVVEQVLSECAASPFLNKLRMRSLGIANSDDRPGRAMVRESRSSPEIVTSPRGVWSREEDLVDVLRRFAGELQRDFSARHKPGLSVDEVGDIRDGYHEHRTQQAIGAVPAGAGVSPASGAQATGSASGPGRSLDVLAGDPRPAQASGTRTPGSQQAQAPQGHHARPDSTADQPSHDGQPQGQTDDQAAGKDASASGSPASESSVPEPEPSGPAESAGLVSRARRWIPELRRRRGPQSAAGEPGGGTEDAEPKTEGLIYLLIVGDESCRDEAALNRSRFALLEVDQKIAELPGFAYQVRMLHGNEDGLRGDLREAGQLGRRDIRRTVASADFAGVLESVRASLRRDRVALNAAEAPNRSAVVFFTPEPPLADTIAAELFRDLAREASIVWALPKSAKGLLSGAFTDVPGVQVIVDDPAVADEIAGLLSNGADTTRGAHEHPHASENK